MKNKSQQLKKKKTLISSLKPIKFEEGSLKNITLYLIEFYKTEGYPHGETDSEMMEDILKNVAFGKTIFDVGTFIGASSLVFSKLVGTKGKVIGFEPNPYNRDRIKKNLSLNPNLAKNITIYPLALSDIDGEMIMTLSSEIDNGYSSTSRLNQSHPKLHGQQLPNGFKEELVKVTTLDNFVSKEKIFPDIIKVDIEGAEYGFLLGARKTIQKYKPVIYVELHSEFCAVNCMRFFASVGYETYILKEEYDNRVMIKAWYSEESLFSKNNVVNKKNEKLADLILSNEHTIASYENSLSWRITKPIRSLKRFIIKYSVFSKNEIKK